MCRAEDYDEPNPNTAKVTYNYIVPAAIGSESKAIVTQPQNTKN